MKGRTAGPALGRIGVAGVLSLALACAGCAIPIDQDPPPTPSPTVPSPAVPSPAVPSPTPSEAGDQYGRVVATRTIKVRTSDYEKEKEFSDPATVRVYVLQRGARVVQLNFMITVDPSARAPWSMLNVMAETGTIENTVGGISLIDPAHGRVYFPGRDRAGGCICSASTDVSPGASVVFTAAYAAPPADVTTMTVQLPLFGAVTRVPLV